MRFHPSHPRLVGSAVALAAAASLAMAVTTGTAQADGSGRDVLHAKLTGAAEVPGPGDPDGVGKARVYNDKDEPDIICVDLRVRDINRATAAHIHEAPVGVAGPVVVTLTAPIGGRSRACAVAGPVVGVTPEAVVADILANPQDYYVNVHNSAFPGGAVRGQLR